MQNNVGQPLPSEKLTCKGCGAYITYLPGTDHTQCAYCGTETEIVTNGEAVAELSLPQSTAGDDHVLVTENFVHCNCCNATVSLDAHLTSAFCPYCTAPLILSNSVAEKTIQPGALLPFKLDGKAAKQQYDNWVKTLWLAPRMVRKTVKGVNELQGVYLPYWTFDMDSVSNYTGERGEYYYETETYTDTEDGKTVEKNREVRKTRWHGAAGTVRMSFDDVLIIASPSMPSRYLKGLEPWDIESLVSYDKQYISGFVTEKYQVDISAGLEIAQARAQGAIGNAVKNDIGGNEQRVSHTDTSYNKVTYKLILLPVYICAYNYKGKPYHIVINARTGEVQGEYPRSWLLIILTIILVILIILCFL